MTAADKLRDLPHDEWPTDAVAAVIEAAQVAADYAHHGDLLEWETHCDSVDPGCPGCALLDSLAALNARLDGAA